MDVVRGRAERQYERGGAGKGDGQESVAEIEKARDIGGGVSVLLDGGLAPRAARKWPACSSLPFGIQAPVPDSLVGV